jgi:hypothetical protein
MMDPGPVAAVSPYVTAAFGLAGSLIGGLIAGTVAIRAGREAREAAEHAWMRDSRRQIYDRFLTNAQRLLVACEKYEDVRLHQRAGDPKQPAEAVHAVEEAYLNLIEVYGVVQTVAELRVVEAARAYVYRLLVVQKRVGTQSVSGPFTYNRVSPWIRRARHVTIDAMREELGLRDRARPPEPYNPFVGTEPELENLYPQRWP